MFISFAACSQVKEFETSSAYNQIWMWRQPRLIRMQVGPARNSHLKLYLSYEINNLSLMGARCSFHCLRVLYVNSACIIMCAGVSISSQYFRSTQKKTRNETFSHLLYISGSFASIVRWALLISTGFRVSNNKQTASSDMGAGGTVSALIMCAPATTSSCVSSRYNWM